MRHIVGLLIVVLSASSASPAEYPNEVEGFKLYAKYCRGLEPMRSTVDDVKKVLGKPMRDDSESDWRAVWFEKDTWNILVYIYPDNGEYPAGLAGKRVKSIDFISIKPLSFANTTFPKTFNKVGVLAADARWNEYYDAFGLSYEVYTSKTPYGHEGPGDLNRISYQPAPHKIIEMQRSMIQSLKKAAAETAPAKAAISFDTYSGYFVSNKFEPDAAESFVVITDQKQFDEVFGVAFVMGDKSHRLAKDAFKSNIVLAAIKRGKAVWEYKVDGVTVDNGLVNLRYTATSKKSDSATFACPLIVSILKGDYKAIQFWDGGKAVKKVKVSSDAH